MQRFQREVVQGTARPFVEAKLAERDARHERAGESRYRVEPNIKDGKGGLRDLHTLHWLAKYLDGEGLTAGDRGGRRSSRRRSATPSAAARTSCGPCAAICISWPGGPRSG